MRKTDIIRNAIVSSQKPLSGHTELEYIESNGQQWIDTGLSNTGDYIFYDNILIKETKPAGNDGQWIIGGRKDPNYSLGVFLLSAGTTATNPVAGYGGATAVASPAMYSVLDKWVLIEFSRSSLYITINGTRTKHSFIGQGLIPEAYKTNILLGKNQVNWAGTGDDVRNLYGYRSATKIIDAVTGEVLRDLIAAKHQNGDIGMYDKSSGRFYVSAGPQPFIAGPEV